MSNQAYTQVTMKNGKGGVYTAWVPSGYAAVGKMFTIDNIEGVWTVREVHGTKTAEQLGPNYATWKSFNRVLN